MNKEISIETICHIKQCLWMISLEYTMDPPMKKVISANKRAINHYLKDYSEEQKQEVLSNINLFVKDCVSKLEELGWKIMKNHYCLYCAFLGVDYRCMQKNKFLKEHIVYKINKCKNFTPFKIIRHNEKRMGKEEVAHYVGKNVEITLDNGDIVKGILTYAYLSIDDEDIETQRNWFVIIDNKKVTALFRYSNVIEIKEE